MANNNSAQGELPIGKSRAVQRLRVKPNSRRVHEEAVITDGDGLRCFVTVKELSAGGTVDVVVFTETEEGDRLQVASFPQISANTTNLLVQNANVLANRAVFQVTLSSGTSAEVDVYARAVRAGQLEAVVSIQGSDSGKATGVPVSNVTAVNLTPVGVDGRQGLIVKNYHSDPEAVLFLAGTEADATAANNGNAFPVRVGEAFAADFVPGVELWAIFDVPETETGRTNVRLFQGGQ